MSKNKKEKLKEKDDIEEYFKEVKNRSFPIGVIFFLMFIILFGGVAYYYYVIDNPKNIFLNAINNTLNKIDYKEHDKLNYEFSLDTNITTSNKEYIDIVNIIEKIALSGVGGIDTVNKKNYSQITAYYQSEKLLNLTTYQENNNNLYLESNDLYDKVIKINTTTINEDNKKEENIDSSKNKDYIEKIVKAIKLIIKDTLMNATYQKKYVDLSNAKVKKITLLIDKTIMEDFYNRLLNNNDFLESYSKITGDSKADIEKGINKSIDELDDSVEKISLYLSVFENEFLMFEDIYQKERITITKENNQYEYKIYNDSIIEYQGFIKLEKINNEYDISLEFDDIKEEISVIFNLDLSLDYEKEVDSLEIKNVIEYEKITENDIDKIEKKLSKNNAFRTLSEDLTSLFESIDTTNTKEITPTA